MAKSLSRGDGTGEDVTGGNGVVAYNDVAVSSLALFALLLRRTEQSTQMPTPNTQAPIATPTMTGTSKFGDSLAGSSELSVLRPSSGSLTASLSVVSSVLLLREVVLLASLVEDVVATVAVTFGATLVIVVVTVDVVPVVGRETIVSDARRLPCKNKEKNNEKNFKVNV